MKTKKNKKMRVTPVQRSIHLSHLATWPFANTSSFIMRTLMLGFAAFFIGGVATAEKSPDGIWEVVADQLERKAGLAAKPVRRPAVYETMKIDSAALAKVLAKAPKEGAKAGAKPVEMTLPMPGGVYARFAVVDSPIMEPALAAKFPRIKSYAGQGIDDPSMSVRFDVAPQGFYAQILSQKGTVFIDAAAPGDTNFCICYLKKDLKKGGEVFHCHVADKPDAEQLYQRTSGAAARSSGTQLRTYRLAMAATAEFTAFHKGQGRSAMQAITTGVNRINGIYEKELSIRLILVANNDKLIYTDAETDPYTNNGGEKLLEENQKNIDFVIGTANYDVGHVVSTSPGGQAGLGVVGKEGEKAQGYTGSPTPNDDEFWVDFTAHELGHQFHGSHTFNGIGGNCVGKNRQAYNAYEPGSVVTIQAYAGICENDDIFTTGQTSPPGFTPGKSIAQFHSASFEEMINFVEGESMKTIGTRTPTGNTAPTVEAGNDYTIPAKTAFELKARGIDADGHAITYSWEQYDLGDPQEGLPLSAGDTGSGPIFRVWPHTPNPTRTFPRLQDLLLGVLAPGEVLPTTTRSLKFRVTVRDNQAGGGGVNSDDMTVNVVATTAGPFKVTSPNTEVTWNTGSNQTVTWNVAGTDGNGINAINVDILLSTDGGNTYTTLVSDTPNDGSHSIVVPNNLATTQARVKIKGSGNIFFDISDKDFSIVGEGGDSFGDAITLTGSTGQVSGSIVGATIENGELRIGGRVWYKWVAPASGEARITATPDQELDVTVAIYTGTAVDSLLFIPNVDKLGSGDPETLTFEATAGTEYKIAVGGFQGSTGSFTLDWMGKEPPIQTTITPTSQNLASAYGKSYQITVTSTGSWTAASNQLWATVSPAAGNGNGSVTVTVAANTATTLRNATITIGDQIHTLTQAGGASAPSNDNFVGALTLDGFTGQVTGSNAGATAETGEPTPEASQQAPLNSIWWKWTAPTSTSVSFDTTGSSFDTVLAVYTGTSVNELTEVTSNDDISPDMTLPNTKSLVTFRAVAGATYWIAVSGYDNERGNITLSWNSASENGVTNDNFANATTLTGVNPGTAGTNVGATTEPGENVLRDSQVTGSVWYKWVAPATGKASIKATPDQQLDVIVAIYTGTAVDSLLAITEIDLLYGGEPETLTFDATAGTEYKIAVGGFQGSTGSFVIKVTQDGGGDGDPTDTDGDGTPDSADAFPLDANKTGTGVRMKNLGDGVMLSIPREDIVALRRAIAALSIDSEIIKHINATISYIEDNQLVPDTDWQTPDRRKDFLDKLKAVLALITAAEAAEDPAEAATAYAAASSIVDDELIIRADGLQDVGASSTNDWVVTQQAQKMIYVGLSYISDYLWLKTP